MKEVKFAVNVYDSGMTLNFLAEALKNGIELVNWRGLCNSLLGKRNQAIILSSLSSLTRCLQLELCKKSSLI